MSSGWGLAMAPTVLRAAANARDLIARYLPKYLSLKRASSFLTSASLDMRAAVDNHEATLKGIVGSLVKLDSSPHAVVLPVKSMNLYPFVYRYFTVCAIALPIFSRQTG